MGFPEAFNYSEVVSHFVHAGMPEREVDAMLDPLPMTVVPVDKALAQLAGRLRAVTAEAGLSLGDRVCLALAHRDGLPAWTSDLGWKKIADAVEVKVIGIRNTWRAFVSCLTDTPLSNSEVSELATWAPDALHLYSV